MVILLVFTIINLKLSESRIFMTPNVWLTTEEDPKKEIENLKPVSPQDNVNKNVADNIGYKVRLKNNPVEELESSPFPKGKKHPIHLYLIFEKFSLEISNLTFTAYVACKNLVQIRLKSS